MDCSYFFARTCFFKIRIAFFVLLIAFSGQSVAATKAEAAAWKVAVGSTLALVYITNALKSDRMIFESGGGESVSFNRIGAQWDYKNDILKFLDFSLDSYFQLDYAKWQSTKDSSQNGAINSIGFTPVFRFIRRANKATVYFDTSIGAALISNNHINDLKFGSNFQFSDSLSIGAMFGERRQWGIGYKYNHMSNNGIKVPNNGINFHLISISYQYP
jgi:lipid A 3-O-deacylase